MYVILNISVVISYLAYCVKEQIKFIICLKIMTIGRKIGHTARHSHKFHIKCYFAWSKIPCETVK